MHVLACLVAQVWMARHCCPPRSLCYVFSPRPVGSLSPRDLVGPGWTIGPQTCHIPRPSSSACSPLSPLPLPKTGVGVLLHDSHVPLASSRLLRPRRLPFLGRLCAALAIRDATSHPPPGSPGIGPVGRPGFSNLAFPSFLRSFSAPLPNASPPCPPFPPRPPGLLVGDCCTKKPSRQKPGTNERLSPPPPL